MQAHHDLRSPLLAALIGTATFAGMDVLMKGVSMAEGSYIAMLWRSIFGVAVMLPAYFLAGRRWPAWVATQFHMMRALCATLMTLCFFYGLSRLPLAEGVALSFIAPVIALYLARVLLHEKLCARAIEASLLGLAGVTVMLWPKIAGNYDVEALRGAIAILFSAVVYAVNLILQRRQTAHSDPFEVSTFQNLFVLVFLALGAPWFGHVPAVGHLLPLAAAAGLATISLWLLSWAYARAEAQYLLPVEYTAFLWAALFGWLVFDETVGVATIFGAGMIIAACMLSGGKQATTPEI